jgi:hypothetical protein
MKTNTWCLNLASSGSQPYLQALLLGRLWRWLGICLDRMPAGCFSRHLVSIQCISVFWVVKQWPTFSPPG